jgi:hypothetical protein
VHVGLFGRKKQEESTAVEVPGPTGNVNVGSAAGSASAIPDYGFNAGHTQSPKSVTDLGRTSSYPAGAEGFARFVNKERTTSYRTQAGWARRTYDTIN